MACAQFILLLPVLYNYEHLKSKFPLGIIDYQVVSRHYAKEVTEKGHEVKCNYEVASFDDVGGDYPISVKSAVSLFIPFRLAFFVIN